MSDLIAKLEMEESLDRSQMIALAKMRRHLYDEAVKLVEKANRIDGILAKHGAKASGDSLIIAEEELEI